MALFSRQLKRRTTKLLRRVVPVLLISVGMLGAVFLHAYLFLSPFGQQLETSQTDVWFRVRGVRPPPPNLLLVSLDEATYRELGLSHLQPLSRGMIAELLEKLSDAGAKACFLDFIFRDPGPSPEDNQRLATALGAFPSFVGAFDYTERDNIANTERLVEVFPRPEFSAAAVRVVKVNLVELDSVRYFTQPKTIEREVLPLPYSYVRWAKLAREPAFQDLINYYGPPGTIPAVSIFRVLQNDRAANEALVKGKLIAVGNALATGLSYSLKDSFMTPTSSRPMAGVEVHATVLGNVQTGDWIHRIPLPTELAFLSAVVVVLTGAFFTLPAGLAVIFYTSVAALWSVWAYMWFLQNQFLPGILAFFVVLPIVLAIAVLAKHRAARGRLKHIGDMLGISGRYSE